MTAIFNSLFWPVALSTQNKVPLSSFCTPPLKVWGSILNQPPNSPNTKDRLHSRQYPRLVDLFTVAASGSLCILLACMDASAVPSFSINSTASLPDLQSRNMAMAIPIPIPSGADDQWGIQNFVYASAPELAMSIKKKENVKHYAGNHTKCPKWNLNEYEIVVPNLARKPNSGKSFPRHGYYWINAQNQANPSLPWNPNIFYRADSFSRRVGTENRQIIRPTDGNMLFYECFSL